MMETYINSWNQFTGIQNNFRACATFQLLWSGSGGSKCHILEKV